MLRPSLALMALFALAGSASAKDEGAPPCAPGEPPATIRASDVEDAGGPLTATHTIGLELHDSHGRVPGQFVSFTLPSGARARGDERDPAFSVDTPGPVQVTATWLHRRDDEDLTTCTASAQRTIQLRPARPLTFTGAPLGRSGLEYFQAGIRAGKNADLRPVELRLRGVRHARLPGPGTRLQTITLPFRRGDAGLPVTDTRRLRAAGWRFHLGYVSRDEFGIGAQVIDSHRGRRGPARGFGFSIALVQAGHRVGRIRAIGRCGYLGCHGTVLR